MAADEKPPKIRGKKEREAAYRQGFVDGLAHAKAELASQRALDAERDEAMRNGLAKLHATPAVRRRRTKADKERERMQESAERAKQGLAPYAPRPDRIERESQG